MPLPDLPRGAALAPIALSLTILIIGAAPAQQAAAPPPPDKGTEPTVEAGAPAMVPRAELDALAARLDQARTALERLREDKRVLESRAAEAVGAAERAAAEAAALRNQLVETRTAAEQAAQEAASLRAQLDRHEQQLQARDREQTAQLNAAELRLREQKERLGGAEARIQGLQQELAARDAAMARLEAAQAERSAVEQQLSQRLDTLRARLPAPEGGLLTAAEARDRAEADAGALMALIDGARGIDNPQLRLRLREAETALHHSQFLLARADNARTVYQVRPGDTLDRVSWLFYGDGEQWTHIFDANRHILDDPGRLLPGLTLVIP